MSKLPSHTLYNPSTTCLSHYIPYFIPIYICHHYCMSKLPSHTLYNPSTTCLSHYIPYFIPIYICHHYCMSKLPSHTLYNPSLFFLLSVHVLLTTSPILFPSISATTIVCLNSHHTLCIIRRQHVFLTTSPILFPSISATTIVCLNSHHTLCIIRRCSFFSQYTSFSLHPLFYSHLYLPPLLYV